MIVYLSTLSKESLEASPWMIKYIIIICDVEKPDRLFPLRERSFLKYSADSGAKEFYIIYLS